MEKIIVTLWITFGLYMMVLPATLVNVILVASSHTQFYNPEPGLGEITGE